MAPKYIGLKGRGLFTATVEVSLNKLPSRTPGFMESSFSPFDTLDMKLSARTTTLTSPWTAKDPAQVIRQMATKKAMCLPGCFPLKG
ncbi:hypothetical protein [Ideonella paludis]|uniref:hypothetical protein n=1 Tax=Ideonella paludis TaxID=1233411 RepID=UPI0036379695